jgi:hypothetical protein
MERVREALEDLKPANPKILPFRSKGNTPENKKAVRGAVTSSIGYL